MISSFYTAATGAITIQKGFDVTANNIANVSTTGYKTVEPTFSDLVHTNIHAPKEENSPLKEGHGAKLEKTATVFTVGNPRETLRPLDFALTDSNTFFAVRTGTDVRYTRCGNFHISQEDGIGYLTAADGGYVLDTNGKRIDVNNENDNIDIGIFSFQNPDGLVRQENTSFSVGAASGVAQPANNPKILRGHLEDSTVDLADEMTSVITLQRAFQMNSKMVQISDELMQTINSMR